MPQQLPTRRSFLPSRNVQPASPASGHLESQLGAAAPSQHLQGAERLPEAEERPGGEPALCLPACSGLWPGRAPVAEPSLPRQPGPGELSAGPPAPDASPATSSQPALQKQAAEADTGAPASPAPLSCGARGTAAGNTPRLQQALCGQGAGPPCATVAQALSAATSTSSGPGWARSPLISPRQLLNRSLQTQCSWLPPAGCWVRLRSSPEPPRRRSGPGAPSERMAAASCGKYYTQLAWLSLYPGWSAPSRRQSPALPECSIWQVSGMGRFRSAPALHFCSQA